jgi:hypothetical protein
MARNIVSRGGIVDEKFLVRIGEMFVSRLDDDGKPLSTDVLSGALHLRYDRADTLCQHIRQKGYCAYVTDIWGDPASLEVIERALTNAEGFEVSVG